MDEDPLAPARRIINGACFSFMIWYALGAIALTVAEIMMR